METNETQITMIEQALAYLKLGWSVIPINPKNKTPKGSWREYQTERAAESRIRAWFKSNPSINIGIVTGKVSQIVVIDVDVQKGGIIPHLPRTVTAKTGGGGKHFFFKYPANIEIKNSAGGLAPHIDIRGEGGLVVAPPSVHPSGNSYEWEIAPWDCELAELPEDILERLTHRQTSTETVPAEPRISWKKFIRTKVPKGKRNDAAIRYAGYLTHTTDRKRWDDKAWTKFSEWNDTCCEPPINEQELEEVFKSACSMQERSILNGDEGNRTRKESQDVKIIEMITGDPAIELFVDEMRSPCVSYIVDGHREQWRIDQREFREWLAHRYYEAEGKTFSALAFEAARHVLAVIARKKQKEHKLFTRFARIDDAIYYDLCDPEWRAIKITKNGWSVVSELPIVFKRQSHQAEQVVPQRDDKCRVSDIFDFINITDEKQKILMQAWLVSCFIPEFPHPMAYISGSQGTAKSTMSRILRLLIDPSRINVVSKPTTIENLAQALAHHSFIFFDNVSHISYEESDLICRAVTGSGFTKRELYSNDNVFIYNIMTTIGINGISLVADRPDLLERSVLFPLDPIAEINRKQEHLLYAEFEKIRPQLLGAILDTVSKAMKIHPTITAEKFPRMADFARWGCAIAEALGYTQKQFLDAYKNTRDEQQEHVISSSVVASTLIKMMENKDTWEGTANELLKALTYSAKDDWGYVDWKDRVQGLPKNANYLGRELKALIPALAEEGLVITRRTPRGSRIITITKKSKYGTDPDDSAAQGRLL
jgi:hypothetical protein